MSCIEIYNELVTDMLAAPDERKALHVREHTEYGFFVEGASADSGPGPPSP